MLYTILAKYKKTILVVLLIYSLGFIFICVITHGNMDLLTKEPMGINYIGALESLKQGRFDLDPTHAKGELFYRDGRIYMYYGIFPSLLRGAIELFVARGDTDWSRISTLIAALIVVISSTLAYITVVSKSISSLFAKNYYTITFALSMAIGSPVLLLLSSAYIYHEAILWGLAWCCVFIWAFINFIYSKNINNILLFVLSLSCGLALLSRPTFASGALLALVLLFFVFILYAISKIFNVKKLEQLLSKLQFPRQTTPLWKTFLVLCIPILLCTLFQLKINYEKWGNPLIFMDFKYYEQVRTNLGRLEAFKKSNGLSNYLRIPHALTYYYIPRKVHFTDEFPYIALYGYENPFNFKGIFFDVIEPSNPVPVNSPYLFFTALVGFFSIVTYNSLWAILILSFLISNVFCLSLYCLSLRYIGDLIPFFIICSIASFNTLVKLESINYKSKLISRTIVLFLTLVGIYTATATTLQQKVFLWPVPFETKENIKSFYGKVNDFLNKSNVSPNFLNKNEVLEIAKGQDHIVNPQKGQILITDNNKTIFWFNGRYWLPIKDDDKKYRALTSYGPYLLKLCFNKPTSSPEIRAPLITTGKPGAGDIVYVEYLSKNKIIFGIDVWGLGGARSEPISIDPDTTYNLEISLGSFYPDIPLNKGVLNIARIKLDNKVILGYSSGFHKTNQDEILVGENKIGGTYSTPKFSGEILEVNKLGAPY